MLTSHCPFNMTCITGTGGLASELPQGKKVMLPDHRPLCLNTDDYDRVCQIPKKKVCGQAAFLASSGHHNILFVSGSNFELYSVVCFCLGNEMK